ncbi:MAG: VWA domain-containing protein, partial [Anaerolineales bacterium]
AEDFVDYTLAMYAYPFHPANPRLDFLDQEIHQYMPNGLIGHTVIQGGGFGTELPAMNPRSVRYWEFRPASQCEFLEFTFSGNGLPYGFSVMTVDNDSLVSRWTSLSNSWSRALYSANLDRAVGVVTSFGSSGTVGVQRGCVGASLEIEWPNASQPRHVGLATNPQNFIVRVRVQSGSQPLAGLLAGDFNVRLQPSGGGVQIPAPVLNGAYVQGDYWVMVRAPGAAEGAVTGQTYDILVDLGSLSDTEPGAVVYDQLVQDAVVVVDHSGSMGFSTGKMEAAINAANLLLNELADEDQGGLVVFDESASIGGSLQAMDSGAMPHRQTLLDYLAGVVSDGETSIGAGMQAAADLHDAGR